MAEKQQPKQNTYELELELMSTELSLNVLRFPRKHLQITYTAITAQLNCGWVEYQFLDSNLARVNANWKLQLKVWQNNELLYSVALPSWIVDAPKHSLAVHVQEGVWMYVKQFRCRKSPLHFVFVADIVVETQGY